MSTMRSAPKERLYLIYPETDGKPMAENTLQFEWIVLIKLGLEACFADRSDVFIAGDLFWYPVKGRPGIRVAPDVLVAIGRPKGHRGSYLQWLEDHIPPQVVFEILSPGNRSGEMASKLEFYERYGVQEYYIYDPDHNHLQGYQRRNRKLTPIPEMHSWRSPLLGIRFERTNETLHLYQPNGDRFFSYLELVQLNKEAVEKLNQHRQQLYAEINRADAARREAEAVRKEANQAKKVAEKARAEAEKAKAEAEKAKAEARLLAEKLRRLGIDPDAVE